MKDGIIILGGAKERIITKVDYLVHAIEPLVWNARDHAYNPANDVYPFGERPIHIAGLPEEEIETSTGSGIYVVRVGDHGSGIPENVLPHIFDRGFSTKEEKQIQHGIGLYGVKKFVENQGGAISVKTELGKGTTFEFTVPYSHVNDGIMIQ